MMLGDPPSHCLQLQAEFHREGHEPTNRAKEVPSLSVEFVKCFASPAIRRRPILAPQLELTSDLSPIFFGLQNTEARMP